MKDGKWDLPLKHIIALTNLERVEPITQTYEVDNQERIFGDYAPGRYAWRFGPVYRLEHPVEAKGRLGLWQWTPPESFRSEIQEQLNMLRDTP